MGLKKTRETIARLAKQAMGDPHHPAKKHHFKPGHETWNKGMNWDSGGNSHKTRFKPGDKPHTTLPIGAYRLVHESSTGRMVAEKKTSDAKGSNSKRWTPVARLVWEAAHGPIPARNLVVFKPGRFTNVPDEITADMLECIDRKEHMLRNHPRSKSPELAKLVQLKGAINRQVNRIAREHAESNP